MSSDGYFDDDDDHNAFDAAALAQLDAIEAAHVASSSSNTKPVRKQDSFYDLTLDIDDSELEKLDAFIADSYAGKAKPPVGATRQTTLFGDVLENKPPSNKPTSRGALQRTSSSSRNPFGQKPKRTKIWDQTAFAQSGRKQKKKAFDNGEEEDDEQPEFEQFPAPFVAPVGPPPPMTLKPDLLEAKHWIFPLNKPKRDYQFNIVKNSLFENTIISVPTGLGKTFIAGVIMLNYYRWFPDGKVVFVAPTKPLVAQQIEASHQSCGIPGSDAAEMTGEITRSKRERLWREKRVFYMTPQTLMNDFTTQNCNVMDIVLLVIDEAHKATGDYAYNQIVRHMMAKNPHFRLIALTATPGSNPMAVQNLVDGLHISHIEIRDENSIDLKPYLHEKKIKQHCIRMTEGIVNIRELLAQFMDTFLKPLIGQGLILPGQRATRLHPYAARAKMTELRPHQKGFFSHLSTLGNLAQAMGYLLEGTVSMAHSYLRDISERDSDEGAPTNQKTRSKKLREHPLFQKVMAAFEAHRTSPTGPFPPHPKMDKTVNILVDYYGQRLPDSDQEEGIENTAESKAMVFVTHREAVDEIVEALNAHHPMIRVSKFIGQGVDKHGKRGQAQKEQLEIIQKFQSGEFNVLVATCIGEEGLDIGEVDLIICYDTQKTPIRMLQRFGRTGRKRAGCVHVLLAEDREEFNLDKARAMYKEVQKSIWKGKDLEFFADVERLLPDHIKPTCLEKEMEIQPYVREQRITKGSGHSLTNAATSKRKRNDDVTRNIPPGACTGFVNVADLVVKGSKKRKTVAEPKDFDAQGEDDEVDKELESGVLGGLAARRTQSMIATSSKCSSDSDEKPKGKLKKVASTTTGSSIKSQKNTVGKAKGKAKQKEKTPLFAKQERDDSVDRELEQGPYRVRKSEKSPPPSVSVSHSWTPSPRSKSGPLKKQLNRVLEDTTMHSPGGEKVLHESKSPLTQAGEQIKDRSANNSMAWLVEDDEDPDIMIVSSPPAVPKNTKHDESVETEDTNQGISPGPRKKRASISHSTNMDILEISSEPEIIMDQPLSASPEPRARKAILPPSSSPNIYHLPDTLTMEPTQPIRQRGRQASRRYLPQENNSSSDAEETMPPPSQRRLRRHQEDMLPPMATNKPKKSSKQPIRRKHNPLFDYAAEHSGDETSAGSSHSEDEVESESDRLFIKNSPITQVSSAYDQTAAYRKSLMTQAPGGPAFTRSPVRNGRFGRVEPRVRRRVVDSSPPLEDDEYEFGSFVVDNDAEISYMTQADNESDGFL